MSVLGMIETATITAGFRASDAMVKAAPVELLISRPITPGKYMVLVTGDVASVEASVEAGCNAAGEGKLVARFVLANLHELVLPAILGEIPAPKMDALGVIETDRAAAIIEAADAACKAAPVRLLRVHLANHIGGKGYAAFVGDVADVQASVAAGVAIAGGRLVDEVVIPNPYEEFYARLTQPLEW